LLMLRVEKVATPATAFTFVVPDRVPADGFVPMAIVMAVVALVTVLPCASCTRSEEGGVGAAPGATLAGSTVNASFGAAPGVTLNALLVAAVKPPPLAVSVYPFPALLTLSGENVATPATALTFVLPESGPRT